MSITTGRNKISLALIEILSLYRTSDRPELLGKHKLLIRLVRLRFATVVRPLLMISYDDR